MTSTEPSTDARTDGPSDGPGDGPWATPLEELLPLLDLAPLGDDAFEGQQARSAVTLDHVFGGLVAAQAVVAAGRTVTDADGGHRPIHSLHAYFLRPGDPGAPITFEVERVRDGRSFSHRRVRACQHGRSIMEMSSSFADRLPGLQHAPDAPSAPAPDSVRPDREVLLELEELAGRSVPYGTSVDAFDLRTVGLGPGWFRTHAPAEEPTLQWVRAAAPVPADPVTQAALLTYASDMRIMHPMVRPHGLALYDDDVAPATIDHTVWFHQLPDVSEWTLWQMDSPWAAAGRGLARASVFTTDGTLVATVAQEGLIRLG